MTVLVYILLCLIWGSTWVAIKIGLTDAPPLWSLALRFIVAISILLAICAIRGYRWPATMGRLGRLAYPGLYMYGLSYALIYFAELYISSALTAVLFASFPVFVAVLSAIRLPDEHLSPAGWLGLAVGLSGVVTISYESLSVSGNMFLGTVLGLGGAFCAAYGLIVHRKQFVQENIVVAVSVQMAAGGIPLMVAAMLLEDIGRFTVSTASVGSVIYLGSLGTVVTFLGYYYLLRQIPTVRLSLIAFITPLVAIFIGVVFFAEDLTLLMAIGTALILSSVLLVVRKSKTRRPLFGPDVAHNQRSNTGDSLR